MTVTSFIDTTHMYMIRVVQIYPDQIFPEKEIQFLIQIREN